MKHSLYSKSLVCGLLMGAIALTSCQKDYLHLFKDKSGKSANPSVFVAGYESNGVNDVAKSWIDDVEVTLSDGSNEARAKSIFVAGNDEYIAGFDAGPVYWKNNTEIPLPFVSAIGFMNPSANSVYVSGGHVYIAGTDGSNAVYWKDGTEIMLNTTDAHGHFASAGANSIFVSGNDVYVAGLHGINAVYWKNGVEIYLTTLTPDLIGVANFQANSIFVKGGNVHIVGTDAAVGAFAPLPKYWKNGTDESTSLDPSTFFLSGFGTNGVFVSGNKVYISGIGYILDPTFQNTAVYWTDGAITVLPKINIQSLSTDIYAKGNDVYVSGSDGSMAVYWKDGSEVTLTDGTQDANATSIFAR